MRGPDLPMTPNGWTGYHTVGRDRHSGGCLSGRRGGPPRLRVAVVYPAKLSKHLRRSLSLLWRLSLLHDLGAEQTRKEDP